MRTTDTSERGLESIIVASLADEAGHIQGDPQEHHGDTPPSIFSATWRLRYSLSAMT